MENPQLTNSTHALLRVTSMLLRLQANRGAGSDLYDHLLYSYLTHFKDSYVHMTILPPIIPLP
jgi:hypothetical protein